MFKNHALNFDALKPLEPLQNSKQYVSIRMKNDEMRDKNWLHKPNNPAIRFDTNEDGTGRSKQNLSNLRPTSYADDPLISSQRKVASFSNAFAQKRNQSQDPILGPTLLKSAAFAIEKPQPPLNKIPTLKARQNNNKYIRGNGVEEGQGDQIKNLQPYADEIDKIKKSYVRNVSREETS